MSDYDPREFTRIGGVDPDYVPVAEVERLRAELEQARKERDGCEHYRARFQERAYEAEAALAQARKERDEAKNRMRQIVSTIYATHGYLRDGEIDIAAKFRHIERLARLDWREDGMPRDNGEEQ